ncbi:FAD binding domain-containing protein [Rhodopseudomonas palustris]|uniref:Xanthine dehydrogenase family protein subunit M n=1 Tax=Rhodopseudomonas palustris TaxID=1076 RepID=A0A418VRH1_RHOPL|nr:xanthine dehydrogenase family protein subunit M [Rhodopseudomonas palustris]RJF78945.1 xanthine dehydrogenase family protein subunit M [Rhodopseudomonas palustris]
MNNFEYVRATAVPDALGAVAQQAGSRFLAGGTTILDLMKCGVEAPSVLIDITRLPDLDTIEVGPTSVRIGALSKMSDVADHPTIRQNFPVLSESLWRGASAQLRNMATIGGNLMQRTRCSYFREPAVYGACNKRNPGSGCAAFDGITRSHAILGTSPSCIATHPGDFAVALVAFDATVLVEDGQPQRRFSIDDFFPLPGDTPDVEHPLSPGELIVAVEVPTSQALRRSHYLKVRDRESYEFATASAAVGVELEADGRTIRDVRVALGGIATRPWRARTVEAALVGRTFDEPTIRVASRFATEGAVDHGENRFKIDLAPRVVARALLTVGGIT